jgi:hypothetical protein
MNLALQAEPIAETNHNKDLKVKPMDDMWFEGQEMIRWVALFCP